MQLLMMLTAFNNLSLSFCQSVVDLLCLGFLSCIPFVPMVMNFFSRNFFSRCSRNSSVKMPVSNFQIKGRQVIGLKFDTKFPFWISFIQSKVFPVTIHLGKLFSWRHLSNWSAILLCKLLRFLIQYHTIRPWAFPIRHFSYLLLYFFNFNIYVILCCQFPRFILHPPQSVFSLCLTAWSDISL